MHGVFQGLSIETGISYRSLQQLNLNPDINLNKPREKIIKIKAISQELWINGIPFYFPKIVNIPSILMNSDNKFMHRDLRCYRFGLMIEIYNNQITIKLLKFNINSVGEADTVVSIREIEEGEIIENFIQIES